MLVGAVHRGQFDKLLPISRVPEIVNGASRVGMGTFVPLNGPNYTG